MTRSPDELFRFLWENRETLGLSARAYSEVISIDPASRIGPDGIALHETVCQYVQRADLFGAEFKAVLGTERPEGMRSTDRYTAYGGGVVILDQYGRVKYHIANRLEDAERQPTRAQYMVDTGQIGAPERLDRPPLRDPPSATHGSLNMPTAPETATIYAYQVGFGDCILVRFAYPGGDLRHMLIDFGTTGLPEHAEKTQMLRIAQDIETKVREGDLTRRLRRAGRHPSPCRSHQRLRATKDGAASGDGSAASIRASSSSPGPRLRRLQWIGRAPTPALPDRRWRQRRASPQAMEDAAGALVAFANAQANHLHGLGRAAPVHRAGQSLEQIGEIDNLRTMSGEKRYAYHGCDLGLASVLPGMDVHVLGPPTLRQTDTIRKQRSSDPDEFWQSRTEAAQRRAGHRRRATSSSRDAKYRLRSKPLLEHRWLQERIEAANGDAGRAGARARRADEQHQRHPAAQGRFQDPVVPRRRADRELGLVRCNRTWHRCSMTSISTGSAIMAAATPRRAACGAASPKNRTGPAPAGGLRCCQPSMANTGSEDRKTEVPRRTLVHRTRRAVRSLLHRSAGTRRAPISASSWTCGSRSRPGSTRVPASAPEPPHWTRRACAARGSACDPRRART